jgi:hypothetical protein
MSDEPYARAYYAKFASEHPDIYSDDALYGLWSRLRDIADSAYPSLPHIPYGTHRRRLDVLVKAELVYLEAGHRYRLRGLDKERQRRAEAGQRGARARWERNANAMRTHSDRNAGADVGPLPSRAEQEQSRAEHVGAPAFDADEPEHEALVWLARHGCYVQPGNGYHRQLVTAVERHGVSAIVGMFDRLARAGVQDGDTKGYVFGALDALRPKPDLRAVEQETRAEEARRATAARQAATRERIAQMQRLGGEE